MTRYLLKVTSSILFGLDEPRLAYEIGEQVADWVAMLHELGIGALMPHEAFSARYEELLEFAEGLESRVMELIRRRRADGRPRADVLSILLGMHDQEGGLTDEELVGQVCVLFAAAHMTTSHSLTWTLFLIAQHPEVARQCWQEAAALAGAPVDPTESYTSRVIRESMRVLPASAYSQRVTDARVTLGPFDLPRGTPIVFTPLITHHLPEFYPEPGRFLPDRWLESKPAAYEYIPFGGGPRMCIGGPLALEIIRITLPAILRRFRLTVEPGSEIGAEVLGTMLNPTHPVTMELAPAGSDYQWSPVRGNIHQFVDLSHTEVVPGTDAPVAEFARQPR
jgi:cytochrome P450